MTLLEEAAAMQEYLELQCSDNPAEIQERISTIAVYHARTGFMLAQAKKELNEKKKTAIIQTVLEIAKTQYLAAGAQNALVNSICVDEQYLVDWLDRLNSTCKHQLDAVRSLLSYEKENLRISKGGY